MAPAERVGGRIESVAPLGAAVLAIHILLDRFPATVLAGHYLMLVHPDGSRIPFSLASPPRELPRLVLHYLSNPGSDDARRVDEILGRGGRIELELPFGLCGVGHPLTRPLLMIAGGTGITQVRSLLLEHLDQGDSPLRLYWGAADGGALYLAEELDALAHRHPRFCWTPAVEGGDAAALAERAFVGRAAEAVVGDVEAGALRLEEWDVLLAGGPPMVWGTVAALRPYGLQEERTRSDVFEYAPRDDLWV